MDPAASGNLQRNVLIDLLCRHGNDRESTMNKARNTTDYDKARIIERPDGYYWQDKQTDEEFGPFDDALEAVADMEDSFSNDESLEMAEGLKEAEEEIGIADWIDPDTGELAEESVPHLEDH